MRLADLHGSTQRHGCKSVLMDAEQARAAMATCKPNRLEWLQKVQLALAGTNLLGVLEELLVREKKASRRQHRCVTNAQVWW